MAEFSSNTFPEDFSACHRICHMQDGFELGKGTIIFRREQEQEQGVTD
jgi:hypothetical protein